MIKLSPLIGTFLLLGIFFQTVNGQNEKGKPKLFSFGVIADVQYADADQVGKRNYRGSLPKLDQAIQQFNQYELSFIASLGDLIDRDFRSFASPLAILSEAKAPIHHVLGNHEFSVEDSLKKEVAVLLQNPKRYYSLVEKGFLMVFLNGMEESMDAYPTNSKNHIIGSARYQQLKSSGANNAQTYNGGLGQKQTRWLEHELKRAEKMGLKTILFCHFPLLPENGLQLWDNREVLDLLKKYTSVVAWFSGHHHEGNYVQEKGIHHLTFKGMVEAESDSSLGIIDVFPDRLVINGFGDQQDQTLKFSVGNLDSEVTTNKRMILQSP
jgi:hypothetical protein